MITRRDLEIAARCTAGADCEVHRIDFADGIHSPLEGVDIETDLQELVHIVEALEPAMRESWDAETSFSDIAARWIAHMATTHGARCAGPHCLATADTPAYVGVLRRMWRDSEQYGTRPDHPATGGYRDAVRDAAHELGVDLDLTP